MIFIAEIGLNYNGNFDLIFEMMKQAKLSGANIVKFQLGWRDKKGEINQLDEFKIKQIVDWSKYLDIDPMFSIISPKAFTTLSKFKFDKYKVASRTLKYDFELAKKIINLKKKTFVSLGMWENKSLPFKRNKKILYLWCKSKYPTHINDLKNFPKKFSFDRYAGYSDHSIGIETCLLAISRGAKIIEKHFTLDKSNTTIRDHVCSATPEEFKILTSLGNDISKKISFGI